MKTNSDFRIMLSKLTLRRAWNVVRLKFSYTFSSLFKRSTTIRAMPMALSIEPTTACNLACPECPSGLKMFSRPTGNLQIELNKKIINELAPWLLHINYYFQGEPFIHPRFLEMVRYASEKNIVTSASTNAHFLNDELARKTVESGLDRLIISIDGTTQESYSQYRINGELSKVIEGTKNVLYWKKKLRSGTPHLIFQFLVVRPNEHQVDDVFALAKELGVDEVRLKTAQVYQYENGNPLIPENENYSRYKKNKNGSYTIKNKMYNRCWRMWSSSVVTWDGKVVPCCFDKDATHRLGDLKNQSFRSVWNSAAYHAFRKSVLQSRKDIDICANCSEGSKVWA